MLSTNVVGLIEIECRDAADCVRKLEALIGQRETSPALRREDRPAADRLTADLTRLQDELQREFDGVRQELAEAEA